MTKEGRELSGTPNGYIATQTKGKLFMDRNQSILAPYASIAPSVYSTFIPWCFRLLSLTGDKGLADFINL